MTTWPTWLVLLGALIFLGLIGWIDHMTGWEWSFFICYAVPIVLVVWKANWRLGFAFALLCTATWGLANIESHPYRSAWGFGLALFSRLFYFVVVVIAAGAVKRQLELDRGRIAALERALGLEKHILEIADQEKERLGRELHDGLGQTLAGIAALSTTLSKTLASKSDVAASASAAEVTRLLNESIGEARDLARGLGPLGLEETGLDAALEALALNVQHRFRIACTVEFDDCSRTLRRQGEVHLFRIAQEAVNNAVAHGHAERIEISLTSKDGEGFLSVQDDGVGLSKESRTSSGIGMRTMAYRARLIGASFEVRSRTTRGTVVTCTFPLN